MPQEESLEDKFDIEKQLKKRRQRATNRVLLGYLVVIVLIFGAFMLTLLFPDFFVENGIFFVAMVAGVLIIDSSILIFFVIKPSDKSSLCIDLMNYLNQKHDAEMKMHIIGIKETTEEMECMDASGKYPRMFMLFMDRPVRPILNEFLKIPMYNTTPTGRLNICIKYRDNYSNSKMLKKAGGLNDFPARKGDLSKQEFGGYEFFHDKERNFLIGSVYLGYQKGNGTITNLAEASDKVLKRLKGIESGK